MWVPRILRDLSRFSICIKFPNLFLTIFYFSFYFSFYLLIFLLIEFMWIECDYFSFSFSLLPILYSIYTCRTLTTQESLLLFLCVLISLLLSLTPYLTTFLSSLFSLSHYFSLLPYSSSSISTYWICSCLFVYIFSYLFPISFSFYYLSSFYFYLPNCMDNLIPPFKCFFILFILLFIFSDCFLLKCKLLIIFPLSGYITFS